MMHRLRHGLSSQVLWSLGSWPGTHQEAFSKLPKFENNSRVDYFGSGGIFLCEFEIRDSHVWHLFSISAPQIIEIAATVKVSASAFQLEFPNSPISNSPDLRRSPNKLGFHISRGRYRFWEDLFVDGLRRWIIKTNRKFSHDETIKSRPRTSRNLSTINYSGRVPIRHQNMCSYHVFFFIICCSESLARDKTHLPTHLVRHFWHDFFQQSEYWINRELIMK